MNDNEKKNMFNSLLRSKMVEEFQRSVAKIDFFKEIEEHVGYGDDLETFMEDYDWYEITDDVGYAAESFILDNVSAGVSIKTAL